MINIQVMGNKANYQIEGNLETILKELAGVSKKIIILMAEQTDATEEEVKAAFMELYDETELVKTSGRDDRDDDGSVGMTD